MQPVAEIIQWLVERAAAAEGLPYKHQTSSSREKTEHRTRDEVKAEPSRKEEDP